MSGHLIVEFLQVALELNPAGEKFLFKVEATAKTVREQQ